MIDSDGIDPGGIDPGGIPTIPGDMDALAGHAAALRGVGSDFATTGQRINTTWQGLGGVYLAPEVGQLLAATAPVQMISASVSADIGTVAGALAGYAAEVRQIQAELASLRSQAGEFVASVAGHDDWTSDGGKVDRNNQLISAVDAQVAAFFDAQRRCANAINALYGGPQYRADNGDGQLSDGEYGYTAEQLGSAAGQHGALPWGKAEEKDRGVLGDIGAFFGGVKDAAVGFFTGLGALVGRDPITGKLSLATAGTAWKGLGTLALAAGIYAIPGGMRFDQAIGVPGLGRGALGETLTNAGKAIIAYDEWGKDPARAAGMATFNIVSAVVGTKGAGAGLRAIGTAARDSRLATVSTAGTVMVRSGEAIGKLPTVSDLAKRAVQRIPGLHLPNLADTTHIHIHIPHHTDIPTPHINGDLPTPHPGSVGDALSHTPHVSGHADAPAEGHAFGPPSGIHHVPTVPAPTHAGHDTPSEHGHGHTPTSGNTPTGDRGVGYLPPLEPGNRSLDVLADSRVDRGASGLIKHVDGRPVAQYLHELGEQRAEQFRQGRADGVVIGKAVGPVTAVALDRHTGEVFEATNGRVNSVIKPGDLHPLLRERLDALRAEGPYPAVNEDGSFDPDQHGNPGMREYPHPDNPLRHAEIKAVNQLLWRRGPDVDASVFEQLRVDTHFPFGREGVRSAPYCVSCDWLLGHTPSNAGRFTSFPPGPHNHLPE